MPLWAKSLLLTEELCCDDMEYVNVGALRFPQIGLGTFPMKGEVLAKSLAEAYNFGYRLFDTAYKYSNESELADNLKNKDADCIVQTKFSVTQLSYKKFLWFKYDKKTMDHALDGSMQRLGMNCLDVYLLHAPSKGYVDFFENLLRYKEQNKVQVAGVCRFNERQLQDIKDAHGVFPELNQIEVHPYYSNKKLIEFCKEKGIVVEARTVLTHGDALESFMQSEKLKKIAADCGKSVPQVILRWVVQQGLIAIVKSETSHHIKENIEVFDFYLTDQQMSMIDSLNRNESFGCVSKMLSNDVKCN